MPTEDDEFADADELAEEIIGKPIARSPEQGIADMETRLRSLQNSHDLTSKHTDSDQKFQHLVTLEREMADIKARIREYKAQLEGRN